MKKCPYCAEEIQDDAIKCKHCGSKIPKATSLGGWLIIIILIGLIFAIVIPEYTKLDIKSKKTAGVKSTRKKVNVPLQTVFDIPTILDKKLYKIKKILGTPKEEWVDPKGWPNREIVLTYEKGATLMLIHINRKSEKIKYIFLSDDTEDRTAEEMMQLGNLTKTNKEYTLKVKQWLNPTSAKKHKSSQVSGIEIIPKST